MATKEEEFSRLKDIFLFRKAVFFIAGLIFGQSLVKYAVLAIMIIYLTDDWEESNLPKAVIILNAQEGLSKVLMIFEAHMADTYFGRFHVVVFSSLSMICGLILLWLVDPAKNLGIFWGVAVLIALGEAGKEPPLKAFLADQLKVKNASPGQLKEGENKAAAAAADDDDQWKDDNDSPAGQLKEGEIKSAAESKEEENKAAADEERRVKVCWSVSEVLGALVGTFVLDEKKVAAEEKQLDVRVKLWWSLFKILGALVGTFGLGSILDAVCGPKRKDYWGPIFVAPAIVMGVSLVIFLLGYPFYQPEERPKGERSPIWAMLKVFTTAFRNRGFQYSEKSTDYFEYDDGGGKIPLSPDIPLSRWVDKAALIVETSPPSAKKEENKVKPCAAAQVKEVKQILKMVPMWATFVVYCITQATGSTFFFEQTANLDTPTYKVSPVSFYLMQASSSNGIMCLSNLVISKWFSDKKLFAYKVRIGLGMACSCLACVAAMLVEKKRLQKVNGDDYYQSPNMQTNMSIFLLTPQFILLGLAEGFTEEGLGDFFDNQVTGLSKSYGPSFNQFAIGLGKFFNIFWVLTFNRWFGKTINDSRLDKYYLVLAILGSCNLFIVYTFVSIFVYKDAKGVKWSWDDSMESCFKGCKNAQDPPDLKVEGDDCKGDVDFKNRGDSKGFCCFNV